MATVNKQQLPGNPTGLLRGEKHNGVRYIFRAPDSPERDVRNEELFAFWSYISGLYRS